MPMRCHDDRNHRLSTPLARTGRPDRRDTGTGRRSRLAAIRQVSATEHRPIAGHAVPGSQGLPRPRDAGTGAALGYDPVILPGVGVGR